MFSCELYKEIGQYIFIFPLSVLEDNDITPYIYGTNRDGQWGNFTSIELSDMDEDDLYEFFRESNDAEDFYVEE